MFSLHHLNVEALLFFIILLVLVFCFWYFGFRNLGTVKIFTKFCLV